MHRSRRVHLAVKDDETEKSELAFLDEAVTAFPFHLTHVLTDRGSCFTDVFSRRCREFGIRHRMTKPYTPQTNGMIERFNRRIKSEVLNVRVRSHADLEQRLTGYNQAYNARRQRGLKGLSPNEAVRRRLIAKPDLANPRYIPPDPKAIRGVKRVVDSAKELMQPNS